METSMRKHEYWSTCAQKDDNANFSNPEFNLYDSNLSDLLDGDEKDNMVDHSSTAKLNYGKDNNAIAHHTK